MPLLNQLETGQPALDSTSAARQPTNPSPRPAHLLSGGGGGCQLLWLSSCGHSQGPQRQALHQRPRAEAGQASEGGGGSATQGRLHAGRGGGSGRPSGGGGAGAAERHPAELLTRGADASSQLHLRRGPGGGGLQTCRDGPRVRAGAAAVCTTNLAAHNTSTQSISAALRCTCLWHKSLAPRTRAPWPAGALATCSAVLGVASGQPTSTNACRPGGGEAACRRMRWRPAPWEPCPLPADSAVTGPGMPPGQPQ